MVLCVVLWCVCVLCVYAMFNCVCECVLSVSLCFCVFVFLCVCVSVCVVVVEWRRGVGEEKEEGGVRSGGVLLITRTR